MARNQKTSAADREALNQFFGEYDGEMPTKPVHLESAAPSASVSEPVERTTMNPLAKTYLANAIQNLTRAPSPKLKDDFRATLQHWRELTTMALKGTDEPTAFINVVMAVAEHEGTFDAARLIRNVASQILWAVAIDVQRDRRLASEIEANSFQDGEPDHVDSEYVAPTTEDEAVDAYIEAHAWLGVIADLLPNDDESRARLGLESGLEYSQEKRELDWVRIYDAGFAIDGQIAKNRMRMQQQDGKQAAARLRAAEMLARLAA